MNQNSRVDNRIERLNNTYELLYKNNNLTGLIDIDGIYSDLYFVFDNIDIARNISFHNILDKVPVSFLKLKNNTCHYKLCELHHYGIKIKNFNFEIDSEPQNIMIYGKRINMYRSNL